MQHRLSVLSLSLAVLLSWGHARDAAPAAAAPESGSVKAAAEALFDGGTASPGDYIVAEYYAKQLSRVTPAGVRTAIYTFGSGTFDEYPMRVAIDGSGNYIVTSEDEDYHRALSLITPDGVKTPVYGWAGGNGPVGVAIDSAGNYIVAEPGASEHALARITPAGVRSVIYNYTSIYGNLISPHAVAIDASGNYIVIEDHAGEPATLSRITPGGARTVVYTFTGGVFQGDLAVDQAGDYILADTLHDTLNKITPAGVRTVIASFGGGEAPTGVAVDSAGNYVVTQSYKQRLSLVTPGGAVSTVYDFPFYTDPMGVAVVPAPATGYSATIWSWDYVAGWLASPIAMDGSPTGFTTPHAFTGLTGSHTFTVPGIDPQGHPFSDWDTGWTDRTITVREAGTYTARYRAGYSVTIWSWCAVEGWLATPITMDGAATGFTTPHTFSDVTGAHTFTVPGSHADGHPFYEWSTGSTNLDLNVSEAGVYTAKYHLSAVLPDLFESAVGDPPAAGSPGMAFGVTDTAANQGTAAAGPTTTRYFLSLDQIRSRFDPPVGSRAVPGLAIGATSAGGTTASVPADIEFGTYYLLACADAEGAVTELVETNNCRHSRGTIVIGAAGLPDLVENWVGFSPPTAKAGSSIEVTDQAGNAGTAPAAESTTRYYLSLDAAKDVGDPRLDAWRTVPALPVGSVAGGTVAALIPVGIAPGVYYLFACADDLGVVTEINEANNCVASAGTVTVEPASKAVLDFTGDGASDILWRHATHGDLWLWPMAAGVKAADLYVRTVADTNWEIRGQGDLDGDGTADLLWRHKTDGTVYYWRMSAGAPAADFYVGSAAIAYDIVGTGDFDGDGKADILWRNPTLGDLWLWRMNGAQVLSQHYVGTVEPAYVIQGLGDLNDDAKTDIVWRGAAGDIWVWLMNGAVRDVQQSVGTVADGTYQIRRVADFDGNGKADLLWWGSSQGDVWIWLMDGGAKASEHYVGAVPNRNYQIVGAGDYDGDARADILWRNTVAGDVWVWMMDGPAKNWEAYVGLVADSGYQIVTVR